MLRAHSRIVQSSRDRMGLDDLTRFVLEDVRSDTVQDTRLTHGEGGTVLVAMCTLTSSFDTDKSNGFVGDEVEESSNGIAATADARDDSVRQLASELLKLLFDLLADDLLEVADDGGEGVRANGRPHEVMGVGKVCDPISHRFIHSIFEGARA